MSKTSVWIKYSILELLFANKYQWARKRSKCLWVRDIKRPGAMWVKFLPGEIELLFFHTHKTLEETVEMWRTSNWAAVEDWRE